MKTPAFLTPLCILVACATISSTQTFEATQQFTLPNIGAVAGNTSSRTINAAGSINQIPFAESVLDDVDELREREHVDSAEVNVRLVSIRLSTDTTFAGVRAVRVHLISANETIELCSRTLNGEEQNASSISCEVDDVLNEATLRQNSMSGALTQVGAQLEVSGTVTARQLNSVVTFEVELNVDASL